MVDQVCTGACTRKKMIGEKFLKDSPSKVWAVNPKSHKIFEKPYFEFEKYAIPIFLMIAFFGTVLSNSAKKS